MNKNYAHNTSRNQSNFAINQNQKGTAAKSQGISSSDSFEGAVAGRKFLRKKELMEQNAHLQDEWKLLALIFDRCLFWIFTILISGTSILLLVAVPLMKNDQIIKPST